MKYTLLVGIMMSLCACSVPKGIGDPAWWNATWNATQQAPRSESFLERSRSSPLTAPPYDYRKETFK